MEKMVNVRLLDFFDQNATLSTLKCEGKTQRTTIDYLLFLEATDPLNSKSMNLHLIQRITLKAYLKEA